MNEIRAKIADVLSDTQLVLNKGTNQGVKLDSDVICYTSHAIKDPDTGESLGGFRRIRLRLKVTYVQDRLCIATVTQYMDAGDKIDLMVVPRQLLKVTSGPVISPGVVPVSIGEEVSILSGEQDSVDKDEAPF